MRLSIGLLLSIFLTAGFSFYNYPIRFDFYQSAGTIITASILLSGSSKDKEKVEIFVNDWQRYPEDANSQCLPAHEWVSVSTADFFIDPNQKFVVNVTVNVPEMRGEKRAEIEMRSTTRRALFSLSKSVLIYCLIKGTESLGFDLKSIDILIEENNNKKLALEIENTGNIHFRPKVEIEVEEKGKKEWVTVLEGIPVYPKSIRSFKSVLPNVGIKDNEKIPVRVTVAYPGREPRQKQYLFNLSRCSLIEKR